MYKPLYKPLCKTSSKPWYKSKTLNIYIYISIRHTCICSYHSNSQTAAGHIFKVLSWCRREEVEEENLEDFEAKTQCGSLMNVPHPTMDCCSKLCFSKSSQKKYEIYQGSDFLCLWCSFPGGVMCDVWSQLQGPWWSIADLGSETCRVRVEDGAQMGGCWVDYVKQHDSDGQNSLLGFVFLLLHWTEPEHMSYHMLWHI